MTLVLVVDDSRTDRLLASTYLEECGMQVAFATDGQKAIEAIEATRPNLVLTDMQMPRMDGLELVRAVRARYPTLPVILMTAHGSERLAVEALRSGASSYVSKDSLSRDLNDTVRDVLAVSHAQRVELEALEYLVESRAHFQLGAGVSNHDGVIGHLQGTLVQFGLCDELDLIRVGTALHEALVNAREHGNLELGSDLRESEGDDYHRSVRERAARPPYSLRSVHVAAHFTREQATISIRDEGPGFDPGSLPDPTDPENLGKVSGRGLFLIRTFMDHVTFNEQGNEITMIKRRPSAAPA